MLVPISNNDFADVLPAPDISQGIRDGVEAISDNWVNRFDMTALDKVEYLVE